MVDMVWYDLVWVDFDNIRHCLGLFFDGRWARETAAVHLHTHEIELLHLKAN